jgi:hypothetical protein
MFFDEIEVRRWNNALPYIKNIKHFLHSLETPVCSHELGYRGTLDCLMYGDDNPIVDDFKTSKRPKRKEWIDSYFLQCAAYAVAVNEMEMFSAPVEEIQIHIFSPDRTQLFIEPLADWVPRWLERLEAYKAMEPDLKSAQNF